MQKMYEKIKSMKLVIIIAVIILGFGGLTIVANNNQPKNTAPELSIQTIKNDVTEGGQLIDVRTPEEFAISHIDGSINLSSVDILAGSVPSAPKDKPIYLYCRSGNRSDQSATILRTAGYTNIIDLGAMTYVRSLGGSLIIKE